jgi:hypothetical protein
MFNGTQLEYPYSVQVFETLFKRVMNELPKGLRQLLKTSNDTNQKVVIVIKYIFENRLTECTPELLWSIINSGELLGMDFGDGSKDSKAAYKRDLYEFYLKYLFPEGGMYEPELEEFEGLDMAYMNKIMQFLESTTIDVWEWMSEVYLSSLKKAGYVDSSDHFLTDNGERRAAQLDLYLTKFGEVRGLFIEAFLNEADMSELLVLYAQLRVCTKNLIREIFDLLDKEAAKLVECVFGSGVIIDIKELGEFRLMLADNDLDFEIPQEYVVDKEEGYGEILKYLGYEWIVKEDLNETTTIADYLYSIDLSEDVSDNPALQYLVDGEGEDRAACIIAAAKRYTFFRTLRFTNSLGAVVELSDDEYIYGSDEDDTEQ